MKRILSCLLCVCLLLTFAVSASAANEGLVVSCTETQLDNGITIIEETLEYASLRTSQKQGTKKQTYKHGDTVIAIIAIKAMFVYDGLKSAVVSKQVTQTDTYSGWTYTQNSFTSVANTVTLAGKLSKLFAANVAVNMSLTCDANGNIS